MTANIELDFKSESSFRTRSTATNLVTSLEFHPICCATVLCHFGQTGNGSVATHFILLGSTATSCATGGYVVVPEHFGRKEEPAGRNEGRTQNKPSFVPKSVFSRCSEITCIFLTCNHDFFLY